MVPSNRSGDTHSPGGSNGCGDDPGAFSGKHLVETGGELGISVPDQELGRATLLGQVEVQIASPLGDPLPPDWW